jgi:hypothetical protein
MERSEGGSGGGGGGGRDVIEIEPAPFFLSFSTTININRLKKKM